jgi:hypothetical protein
MDRAWWEIHQTEVSAKFVGERLSSNPVQGLAGVKRVPQEKVKSYGNSGAACISFAASCGARRIFMLGYDCQHTGGKTHWHGDHPRGCVGNAGSVGKWPARFKTLSNDLRKFGVDVVNCSRVTALDCFARKPLEDCLHEC